jgi:Tfp pilus assembly protein PilF
VAWASCPCFAGSHWPPQAGPKAKDGVPVSCHEYTEDSAGAGQGIALAEAQTRLARACLDGNQITEAVAHAREAVRLAPSSAASHLILGEALVAEKEELEAQSEFREALRLEPGSAEAHFALGQLRLIQQRPGDARNEFRRAIESSPDFAPAYAALGALEMETGHQSEARDLLERAVALDSGDWPSQYRLATLLVETPETARATTMLENVLRMRPEFLPAREQLGLGLLRRGDLNGAEAQAGAIVARDPKAAEGHHLMALVFWKRREYDSSLAECAMAIDNETDPTAMLALQSIELWQLDRKKDARAALVRAAKTAPNLGTPEVFCRLVYCELRDFGPVGDFLRKNRWAIAPPDREEVKRR